MGERPPTPGAALSSHPAAATAREGWGDLERKSKEKLFLPGNVNSLGCAQDLSMLYWDPSPNWPSTRILPVLLPSCLWKDTSPSAMCHCPSDPHRTQPQPEMRMWNISTVTAPSIPAPSHCLLGVSAASPARTNSSDAQSAPAGNYPPH